MGLGLSFSTYEKENPMTKFTLFGVAAILSSALAGPAMAQHLAAHPEYFNVQTGTCGNREAGNPYSKDEDYMAWSAWRSRGGWDDHNDWRCLPNSHLHQHEVGF
jgi:hypothetical protein